MADLEELARRVEPRLTSAMREALLRRPCPSWWGNQPAIMRPRLMATAEALRQRGLILDTIHRKAFPLTELGQIVADKARARTQGNQNG